MRAQLDEGRVPVLDEPVDGGGEPDGLADIAPPVSGIEFTAETGAPVTVEYIGTSAGPEVMPDSDSNTSSRSGSMWWLWNATFTWSMRQKIRSRSSWLRISSSASGSPASAVDSGPLSAATETRPR